MSDNTSSQSSNMGDEQEPNATIGGPTAHAEGLEYQMVSQAAIEAVTQTEGAAGKAPDDRADAGRDPEYYQEKDIPEGSDTDKGERNQPDESGEQGRRGGVISRAGHPD
ncbi:MAG TPA: hypothetical protein VEX13_13000 [Chloroflexia bacterium]|nr:hypothetical protein [Chloroflexia bacterium]